MQDIAIYLNQNFNRSHGYDCANVVFTDEKGRKNSKMVEMGSLLKAFQKSVVETVELTPIGEIPFGYYNGAVGIRNNKLKADIVTVLPASMQMMQYENTQYDVCVPSLVFSFHVDKGRLEKTRVFVLKMINRRGIVCFTDIHLETYTMMGEFVGEVMYFRTSWK